MTITSFQQVKMALLSATISRTITARLNSKCQIFPKSSSFRNSSWLIWKRRKMTWKYQMLNRNRRRKNQTKKRRNSMTDWLTNLTIKFLSVKGGRNSNTINKWKKSIECKKSTSKSWTSFKMNIRLKDKQ